MCKQIIIIKHSFKALIASDPWGLDLLLEIWHLPNLGSVEVHVGKWGWLLYIHSWGSI